MSADQKWPKAIFYDSKTTLFDWGVQWVEASRRILEKYNRTDIDPADFKLKWNFYHTYYNHIGAFGAYRAFQANNQRALMHAFEYYDIPGSPEDVRFMQELWDAVMPFPDVAGELKNQQKLTKVFIFSNIETSYLDMMVKKLDGFEPDFIGDMEIAQCSKPCARAYYWVLDQVGMKPQDVIYCARPQWDVQGAMALGIKAIWLNRGDDTLDGLEPDHTVRSMSEVTDVLRSYIS